MPGYDEESNLFYFVIFEKDKDRKKHRKESDSVMSKKRRKRKEGYTLKLQEEREC